MLKISGFASCQRFVEYLQAEAACASVFDNRHESTYRLYQSNTATKYRKPQGIPIADFTLLVATTDEYCLLQPLRDRMKLLLRYEFYSVAFRAVATLVNCDLNKSHFSGILSVRTYRYRRLFVSRNSRHKARLKPCGTKTRLLRIIAFISSFD